MKTKFIFLSLFATVLILCTPQFSRGSMETVSPEEADRVLKEIFSKNTDMYRKYSGIESIRKEVIAEFDAKTNKLLSTSEITRVKGTIYEYF